MYSLKGFVTHANLINNTPGTIAPYGELSTQSMTYSREKGYYKSLTSNEITFVSFSSLNNGSPRAISQDLANNVITIAKYIFDKAASTVGQTFSDDLALELLTNFGNMGNSFVCGAMVENGGRYAPEWVSWRAVGVPDYDVNNNIKIWLSDSAFKLQYDEFNIVVVPPIVNLDDFFRSGVQVHQLIDSFSQSELINRVQLVKGNNPESFINAEEFDYIDPLNSGHKVKTTWHVLIYGVAGNNSDAINEAIAQHILSRSTHTREEWTQILPDIFKRTEFIVVPFWNAVSIPNRQLQSGIYSPVTSPNAALNTVKQIVPSYAPAHINDNMQVLSNSYKSLQMGVIGGADNRYNLFKFTQLFNDYINTNSISLEFGRMTQRTQDWSTMMTNLLVIAESATEFTSIPPEVTRTKRNNVVYIVKRFENINYMVATKASVVYIQPVHM